MASLLVRLVSGPLCDMFGPRNVFGGLLLLGAVPTGLTPLIRNATGLYLARFFMGILGGTFVPCQVWSTAFFDKNVVGSANAMTGGFGNAGGGITYFIMPAVFNSLARHHGYSDDVAWRLAFLVPLVVVLATGVALLVLCPDTPDGPWAERQQHAQQHLAEHHIESAHRPRGPAAGVGAADGGAIQGVAADAAAAAIQAGAEGDKLARVSLGAGGHEPAAGYGRDGLPGEDPPSSGFAASSDLAPAVAASSHASHAVHAVHAVYAVHEVHEARLSSAALLETARGEIVLPPTPAEIRRVTLSRHTWALMLAYLCSFGAELAVNAVLAAYYLHNFPSLGQTGASNWAAMFGFLNVVTRPMGGIVADVLYRVSHHSLWRKRAWIAVCGVLSGVVFVVIGQVDPHHEATMFGLVALCAVFLEAGNGANFALVPHVHPFANGIVSGLTGAAGNVGGVLFSIVFRFTTQDNPVPGGAPRMDYAAALWIIGVIVIVVNVAVAWIPPIPKNQVGGR